MWGKDKRLEQAQLTGAGNGFSATLNLQFFKNPAVVPFDRIEGEKKPLADLSIRESMGYQL